MVRPLGDNTIVQVQFYFQYSDSFRIIKAKLKSAQTLEEYEVIESTSYVVETTSNSDFGVVTSINRQVACSEEGQKSYFIQTL